MVRSKLTVLAATGMTCLLTAFLVARSVRSEQADAGPRHADGLPKDGKTKSDMKMTKAEKIANAIKAAPSGITDKAAILDWPSKEGMAPRGTPAGDQRLELLPGHARHERQRPGVRR
jgi:hypothetical protein